MNKDKREAEYPTELESQFVLRLPEEPAKVLRELLKSGDSLKNRLTIQIENDMRNGEVRLDHWLMHAKIIDLPTIVESLKTIDNKSFYKTADICQMMICKDEPDQTPSEEEAPSKHKKKDPYKVDKKFLWPHGITPPTKNVRKRRFRKTLKKKYVEAPEIEKEVKRLLRADNEACQLMWEVIKEEDEPHAKSDAIQTAPSKPEKKTKAERSNKKERDSKPDISNRDSSSNVVDIFGGAVSDSDIEEDPMGREMEESHMSPYDSRLSDTSSIIGMGDIHKRDTYPIEFESQMFHAQPTLKKKSTKRRSSTVTSTVTRSGGLSSEEDVDYLSRDMSKDNMSLRMEQLRTELEELKQRRQRTQHEIAGMENVALRQRFQDILHTLNQDVMYKEMEYQGLITLQNSEDI
ncbi:transcription initiation factor TFIID subunit 7-like [Maniola jurtina]|uniref:transcription initiation factor TFIID subunit 7-like n=1 Tax=Maniola jurtina TaxID=191418 RepID=UPI001E687238|nr:transcription initiation factor TFIID subunit 7-like [Maniola jurtina]